VIGSTNFTLFLAGSSFSLVLGVSTSLRFFEGGKVVLDSAVGFALAAAVETSPKAGIEALDSKDCSAGRKLEEAMGMEEEALLFLGVDFFGVRPVAFEAFGWAI
jgi:hypothetical protein